MSTVEKRDRSWRVFAALFSRHPFYTLATIGLLLLSSTFEGIGIAMLLPLLNSVTGAAEGGSAVSRWVDAAFGYVGLVPTLPSLILVVVVLIFFKALFRFAADTVLGTVSAMLGGDFRHRIVDAMMQARWRHFVSLPNGRVASAIGSEANVAASCYVAIVKMIASTLQVAVQLSVALMISWKVTLAACLLGGLIALMSARLVSASRKMGQMRTEGMAMLSTRLLEAIGGMKALKGMGAEDRMVPLLRWEIGSIKLATRNLFILTSAIRTIPEPVAACVIGASLFVFLQYMGGQIESFLVLALLLSRAITSVAEIQRCYQRILACEPSFWFVENIVRSAQRQKERSSGKRDVVLAESVRFANVGFDYGEHRVLDNVDLQIAAGTVTAFSGLSGAGKTTLVDLVAGLHEPGTGAIYIDGVPLNEIDLNKWRSHIGYVLQETFLFHETIRNNVTLGDPALSEDDTEAALRKAGAWQFVSRLPEGMNTVVGERGARLSGGQRQRIAIARALVRRPSLLILDEPTVGLDRQTESEICEAIARLRSEMTILAISHQPALFDITDTVYQVRDGKVSKMTARGPGPVGGGSQDARLGSEPQPLKGTLGLSGGNLKQVPAGTPRSRGADDGRKRG